MVIAHVQQRKVVDPGEVGKLQPVGISPNAATAFNAEGVGERGNQRLVNDLNKGRVKVSKTGAGAVAIRVHTQSARFQEQGHNTN